MTIRCDFRDTADQSPAANLSDLTQIRPLLSAPRVVYGSLSLTAQAAKVSCE